MFQKLLKNPSNRFQHVNNVEYIKNDKLCCTIRLIDWNGLISGTFQIVCLKTFNLIISLFFIL